jgi:GT2 family glycosyltransferase
MREDVQYSDKTIQFWQCPKFHVCLFEGFFIYQKLHHRRERIISNRACERNDSSFIDVPVVPGSFFGVNMTLFRNVDLMDENTFLWYEENCLAKKAELSHYKEAILLDCKYIHNHKLKKKGKTLYSEYLKSKEFYCRKYLKLSSLSFGVLRVFDFISLIEHKTLNFFARLFRK